MFRPQPKATLIVQFFLSSFRCTLLCGTKRKVLIVLGICKAQRWLNSWSNKQVNIVEVHKHITMIAFIRVLWSSLLLILLTNKTKWNEWKWQINRITISLRKILYTRKLPLDTVSYGWCTTFNINPFHYITFANIHLHRNKKDTQENLRRRERERVEQSKYTPVSVVVLSATRRLLCRINERINLHIAGVAKHNTHNGIMSVKREYILYRKKVKQKMQKKK